MAGSKTCVMCNKAKPFKAFPHRKEVRKGRKAICCECNVIRLEHQKPENVRARRLKSSARFRTTIAGQYINIRQTMKRRGRRLEITVKEFGQMLEKSNNKCFYCGVEMNRIAGDMLGRTLDRKDNNKEYTVENVVFSCRRCNLVKNDVFSASEMLEIAEKYIKPKLADVRGWGF